MNSKGVPLGPNGKPSRKEKLGKDEKKRAESPSTAC